MKLWINAVRDSSKSHEKRKCCSARLDWFPWSLIQTATNSPQACARGYVPPVQCQRAHTDVYVGDWANGARLWSALRWCGSADNQSRSSRWCWDLRVWPPPPGSSELQTVTTHLMLTSMQQHIYLTRTPSWCADWLTSQQNEGEPLQVLQTIKTIRLFNAALEFCHGNKHLHARLGPMLTDVLSRRS